MFPKHQGFGQLANALISILDPSTHRASTARFARFSKSRLFLPRYRLAPQNPFPAALIDALQSYLYLLYPPPGAFHSPVSPSKLIISGDSAGGGLSMSLLLLLHHLHETRTPIIWHNTPIVPPLPAGLATLSPWTEISRCFGSLGGLEGGSEEALAKYDYLGTPMTAANMSYSDSAAWNAEVRRSSRRTQFYAPDDMISNPFVSPMLAESWPVTPQYIVVGDESLRDQALYTAARILKYTEKCRVEKYTGMPHVFQSVLAHHPASDHAWRNMARFSKAVTGAGAAEGGVEWKCVEVHPKKLTETPLIRQEMDQGLALEEVGKMVERAVVRYREVVQEKERGTRGREVGSSKI